MWSRIYNFENLMMIYFIASLINALVIAFYFYYIALYKFKEYGKH